VATTHFSILSNVERWWMPGVCTMLKIIKIERWIDVWSLAIVFTTLNMENHKVEEGYISCESAWWISFKMRN